MTAPASEVPPTQFVLGVDLGGTKCAAALVDPGGVTGAVRTVPTPASEGPEAVLDAVAALICDVLAEASSVPSDAPETPAVSGASGVTGASGASGVTGMQDATIDAVPPLGSEAAGMPASSIHGAASPVGILAIGVGTAGVVDTSSGTIVSATDAFADWVGTEVATGLRRRLEPELGPVPVHVQNDVDAHAAGEAWLGAAAGADPVLMVTVGTGVGGAIVFGGRPLRGAHHLAGEMGHMPTPGAEGIRCACGRPGHVEAIASGPGLHRRYLALGGDAVCVDARAVVARADAGDGLAIAAVRDAATALGRAIAGVCTVLDPEVVVIGGGLAAAGPLWWQTLERTVRAEVVEPLADLPLRAAALGQRSAIIGAARAAWHLVGEDRSRRSWPARTTG